MSEYKKITTHKQDMVRRLPYQFRHKNGTYKQLVEALGQRIQDTEDLYFQIYLKRFVDYAEGSVLEWIGQEAGIKNRPINFTDEQLRILIKAQIAVLTSHGLKDDLIQILRILGADEVSIQDLKSASALILIKGDLLLDLNDIKNILIKATHPISFQIIKGTDKPFGFLENPSAFGLDEGELGDSINT